MRKFIYDGRELPDPNPSYPPERFLQSLSMLLPQLYKAEIRESREGEDDIYEFVPASNALVLERVNQGFDSIPDVLRQAIREVAEAPVPWPDVHELVDVILRSF